MTTSVSTPGWVRERPEAAARKVEWPLFGATGLLLAIGLALLLSGARTSVGRLPIAELLLGLGVISAGAAVYSGLRRPRSAPADPVALPDSASVAGPGAESDAAPSLHRFTAPPDPALAPESVEPVAVAADAAGPISPAAAVAASPDDPLRQLEHVLRVRSPQLFGSRAAASPEPAVEPDRGVGTADDAHSPPAWPRFGPAPTPAARRGPGLCVRCHAQLPAGAAWRRCGICGSPLCANCLVESLRIHGRAVCDDCAKLIEPGALTAVA